MFERVPCKVEKGACKAERGRVGSFLFVDLVVNVRQDVVDCTKALLYYKSSFEAIYTKKVYRL